MSVLATKVNQKAVQPAKAWLKIYFTKWKGGKGSVCAKGSGAGWVRVCACTDGEGQRPNP